MISLRIASPLTLAAAALALALPLATAAAPAMPGGGRMAQGIVMHFLEDPEVREQAGITDEQVEQIRARLHEARQAMIEHRAALESAELELERLWQADEPDAAAIRAAITRIGELRTQQQIAGAETRLAIHGILTAEQRETLKQLGRERMREHREQAGPARPGLRERVRAFRDRRHGPAGPQAGAPPAGEPDLDFGPDLASGPAAPPEPPL